MAAKYNPNQNKDIKVVNSFKSMKCEDNDGNNWTLTADKNTSRFTLRKNNDSIYSHVNSHSCVAKAVQLGIALEVA